MCKFVKNNIIYTFCGNFILKYGNKVVDQSKVFEKLKRIIENHNYWEKQNSTKKVEKIGKEEKNTELNKFNFIDIIDRNYDEVIFLNMFQYIFSANTEVFCSFAKTVLKSDLKNNKLNLSQNFIIERERGHTDLLITDKENKNIIVIENKIKSGINGKEFIIGEEKIKGQLYDYCYYVKGYIRGNIQEEKYIIDKETGVKYIENKDLKREFELYKNKFFYVFVPNYSYINEKNIYPKNTYKIIKYSQIYDFFNNHKNSFKEVLYFKEFLYALKKHISNTDNILEKTMHKRFIDVINNKY